MRFLLFFLVSCFVDNTHLYLKFRYINTAIQQMSTIKKSIPSQELDIKVTSDNDFCVLMWPGSVLLIIHHLCGKKSDNKWPNRNLIN